MRASPSGAPDHQGLSAGKDLLEHAPPILLGWRDSQAVLHVFADNTGAIRLYESTGWQRIGDEIMIDPLGKRSSWTYSYPLDNYQETVR
jgi:ribosomal protein S18 acetylase RimI-like enzyme